MCGLTGFLQTRPLQPEQSQWLQDMMEVMYHRGPDGYGRHLDPEAGLAMGHARLSIIDLEQGDQPLYSNSRQQVLTVNGEFYDFKPARANLMCEGGRFQTKSDSEIALHLYERHGLDFVQHLRGEFAFALFDKETDTLLLVRDRFGIRPLFFHFRDDLLVYGSEVKTLLTHPEVPREFSHKAALHQMMQTMVPGTTAFEGIHAVKPGHMMIIKRQGDRLHMREHRYWDMDFPEAVDRSPNFDEQALIRQVREKLVESVKLRLEADVPVGCYLSGGIDSCSILGMATGIRQDSVKAFTISFDDDSYDESAIAKEMAAFTQADHDIMPLSAEELYGESYIKTVWHSERTFYNTLGVAKWHMSRHVRDAGYKVVITGEGADELFGGYAAFKRDMFLHGITDAEERKKFQALLNQNNALFTGAILSEKAMAHPAFDALMGFTPSWIQPWMLTLELARPLLHGDLQAELAEYDPIQAIADTLDPSQIKGRHPLDKAQYTWIKTMLEGQILNWGGDRVDMAHSVESRPAFLDHHVAELARTLPPEVRIKGNTEKWVLREAMQGVLPEVLYKREKFAFMAPPGNTNATKAKALRNLIDRFMSPDRIRQVGLCDPARLSGFIDTYFQQEDPVLMKRSDALMNHLLGLHILYDHFLLNPALKRASVQTA
jgi:asparagine synthase (glutamine-hydrolysing)